MATNPEQHIIPRRNKRRASIISPIKPADRPSTATTTPTKKRAKKRVRFSDSDIPTSTSTLPSTGLTPAVRNTSLSTPRSGRISSPAPSTFPTTIQFTPFKQVLDDRCKRRIRRNGLSNELNAYESEKRDNSKLRREIEAKDAELQKLKTQLEEARQCTEEPGKESTQSRVDEVEAELEELRQSFGLEYDETALDINWDDIPRNSTGPASAGGSTVLIYEDENDATQPQLEDGDDALAMGLELESARQAKESLFRSSFTNSKSTSTAEIHFEDSPSRPRSAPSNPPGTPRAFYHSLSKQLKAATSRAEDAELALQALEGEVRALGFSQPTTSTSPSQTDALSTLASTSLTSLADAFRSLRLDLERLLPGETPFGFSPPLLLPEVTTKLRSLATQLASREAELKALRDQQRTLRGNFEHALLAAEKAGARVKELEEALEMQAEETLGARMRSQDLERQLGERERDNEALRGALESYRGEVGRLEELIGRVEREQVVALEEVKVATRREVDDMEARVASEELGRRKAEESAVARLGRIRELEEALGMARERAEVVERQLQKVGAREEDVGVLNSKVAGLATALANADGEIEKLRAVNTRLEERYRVEVEQGARAVEKMQEEMVRSVARVNEYRKSHVRGSKVRLGNWELESDDMSVDEAGLPLTPTSVVRFADVAELREIDIDDDHVPGSVEMSRGKKHHRRISTSGVPARKGGRRRYDSGIGMDSLGEEDEDLAGSGMMTPELSSEPDVDMDGEVVDERR